MLDLYTWPTPNGRKIHMMVEELGIPYTVKPVNITKGEQFDPAFLAINPNHKIPAAIDWKGPGGKPIVLFESATILEYLAEKHGQFLPQEARARWTVKQWLYFQMGGVGPMFGQQGHFNRYAPEPIPYAQNRYDNEVKRLYDVMNRRLGDVPYLGGDYSIADMATYPWAMGWETRKVDMADFPNVQRWLAAIAARPATTRAWAILNDNVTKPGPISEEHRRAYFGDMQYQKRS